MGADSTEGPGHVKKKAGGASRVNFARDGEENRSARTARPRRTKKSIKGPLGHHLGGESDML